MAIKITDAAAPVGSARAKLSPEEANKATMLRNIENQRKAFADPNWVPSKQTRKGDVAQRRPRLWPLFQVGAKWALTVKFGNKDLPYNGKPRLTFEFDKREEYKDALDMAEKMTKENKLSAGMAEVSKSFEGRGGGKKKKK